MRGWARRRPRSFAAASRLRPAARLERDWERWDAEHGFAWKTLAGIPTPADRARLEAGERPADGEPADPPGFELLA
jgi:hypothetical protein